MDREKLHWLGSITPEQLEQMSYVEQLQLLTSIPFHYLIIIICVASIFPAIFTAISASIINVPKQGFVLSYLAVLTSGIISTLMILILNNVGMAHWLFAVAISIVTAIAANCFYFSATWLKALLIFILSIIFETLVSALLMVLFA